MWRALLICLLSGLASAGAPPTAAAAESRGAGATYWNQFRGPNGDGNAGDAKIPVEFGEDKNVKWKVPIEGKAWSSPVVWGEQVWVTTATEDGKRMSAVAVGLGDGKVVHNVTVFENPEPQYCHPLNSYGTPTPVVEAGRVYVHFGVHGTACLDTKSGKVLWSRRDLPCNHHRGPASSPIVHGDLLVLHFDGFDVQYVVALDKNTGKTVWRHDRAFDFQTNDGDAKKAYGTPTVIKAGGKEQLISPAAVATEALDPKSGDLLWTVRHGGMNASARPLFAHGLVFLANGMGQFLAVKPAEPGAGDITGKNVAWDSSRSMPKRSSPVLVGEHLYMVSDNGVAACVEAKTGKEVWSERLDGGEYAASPIHASGKIYFFSMDGMVTVVEAGPTFKVLAEHQFDQGFMASPAVVGDAMVLRTKTHLYRIGQ